MYRRMPIKRWLTYLTWYARSIVIWWSSLSYFYLQSCVIRVVCIVYDCWYVREQCSMSSTWVYVLENKYNNNKIKIFLSYVERGGGHDYIYWMKIFTPIWGLMHWLVSFWVNTFLWVKLHCAKYAISELYLTFVSLLNHSYHFHEPVKKNIV